MNERSRPAANSCVDRPDKINRCNETRSKTTQDKRQTTQSAGHVAYQSMRVAICRSPALVHLSKDFDVIPQRELGTVAADTRHNNQEARQHQREDHVDVHQQTSRQRKCLFKYKCCIGFGQAPRVQVGYEVDVC